MWGRIFDPPGPWRFVPRQERFPLPPVRQYSYRRTLPHLLKDNRPLFVTFARAGRWLLPACARDLVMEQCIRQNTGMIDLYAAVVMPDHVHLLFTPLRDAGGWPYTLPSILRVLKGTSARAINMALQRSGAVWQDECFDHVLRSNESLAQKVEHVCANPVVAGLVREVSDYRWVWKGEIPVI